MTSDQFPAFYQAVHGYPPFPWQVRLARRVAEEGWPGVLALPTAAGKTSAIDIAVFALALQANRPLSARTAPLRIFLVIDRRLVVDQGFLHADKLRFALENPGQLAGASPEGVAVVREVGAALRRFGGLRPLHVTALRGGMYRDETWTKAPNQPTVCVSTVDQVGSRLLFRGYGVSQFAQPVHAALTGNDALYLIDEAHLSQPFLETLGAVRRFRGAPWAEHPLSAPFQVVEISATPHTQGARFALADEDRGNEELNRRLSAPKPARLVEPARFEQEAAQVALAACSGEVKIVGVVVNRVASAREIFGRLPGEPFGDKVLLTGRIRPWDRDQLLGRCLDRVQAGRQRTPADRPLFLVATMTVEVGADLDLDYLVAEAAPLAALRQRFGRLDRLGRFGRAAGAVVLRKAQGPDPIYGDELAATWEWLRGRAGENDGVLDFGINALDGLISRSPTPPPASTPRRAPALFPAHLDALVQTSPAPTPSPDVAPFLHGAEALDSADIQIVWRADLEPDREEEWLDVVTAAPPRSREALSLPANAVRTWLRGVEPAEVADIEGTSARPERQAAGRPVLRWRGPDPDDSRVIGPHGVRPGDTLVVPSVYGGADEFGWNPGSCQPVVDVGDLCVNDMANGAPDDGSRRLIRLRLPQGGGAWRAPPPDINGQGGPSLAEQVRGLKRLLDEGDEIGDALDELLTALAARGLGDPLATAALAQMAKAKPRVVPYPAGVVLTARVRPGFFQPGLRGTEEPAETDDGTDVDDTSSLRAGTYQPVPVSLARHTDGVVRWVRSFTDGLKIGDEVRAVLGHAARLHDLGKADRRFQFVLYGDEPGDVLLAKSGKDLDAGPREQVRRLAGLPRGFRHEFVSVALVRNHSEQLLGDLSEGHRRLVAYLIGTHHGRGRPFVPVIREGNGRAKPEPVALDWAGCSLCGSADHQLWRLDARWADMFWELVHRYGYWGLAYLEAVLRLADTTRSAEEQRLGVKCDE